MKGIALISAVIFLAFTIVAVAVVYQAGIPIVAKMQATAAIEKMKSTMAELDKLILEVASEGKGSKRTIYFNIDPGTLYVNGTSNLIYWTFETTALIISPRTSQQFGNLIIGSNLDTSVKEVTYNGIPAFQMENEHLRVYVKRFGSVTNYTAYNTVDLLLGVDLKDTNATMPLSSLNVSIDNSPDSISGTGYTVAQKKGENLPYGTITAFMDSSYVDYSINLTLESGTDFLEVEVSV